jgi:8-oxo-dGTP pyrophosphatase MutT (NUDIX family)
MPGWDNFEAFATALHRSFKRPLPGINAQYKLVPSGRAKPDLEHIKHARNPRYAGVLALFYPIENVPHVVLMKRTTYPGVHSGQISFPGGQKEHFDHDIIATALREADEEVGIQEPDVQVVGSLTEVYIPPSNFLVTPVIGLQFDQPSFKADKTEVDSILEVPFHQFLLPENLLRAKVEAGGYTLQVPSYHVQNEVIWGATAMMISELTHLFKQ